MKTGKNSHFAFLSPPLGDLKAVYDVHLRLIGKLLVEFLLVIIEVFSLGVMADVLRANTYWKLPFLKAVGHLWSKISATRGHPPPTILCVKKTRCIDLSYSTRMRAEVSFTLSQCTCLMDRQTDRCSSQYRSCIAAAW